MRVPILLVMAVALIASGCASVHTPVVQGPDTEPIDTTVSEIDMETAGSSEAETTYRPETLEWAGIPSPSFFPTSTRTAFRLGVIVGLCAVGLSFLWAIIFD